MQRTYPGIDILKYIFACLIPLLHIPFGGSAPVLLQQYVARLGVPFFFAASGFFLARSLKKRGPKEVVLRHLTRVGKLLLVWLVIYSPILLVSMSDDPTPVRTLLFKTPAYLWYLSALLVAGIPFCLIRNRKLLWGLAGALYLFGTLIGESWSWLTGGFPGYTEVFLTTRNGLFFGLPMMCAGELAGHLPSRTVKMELFGLVAAVVALWAEIFFVLRHAVSGADTSLYLLLPVVAYFLLRCSLYLRAGRDTGCLRDASVSIYVMQFGFITVLNKLRPYTGMGEEVFGWFTWLAVIVGGTACGILLVKNKLLKHLFR